MRKALVLVLVAGLSVAPSVLADGFDPWQFSFTANGGAIPNVGVGVFPLYMSLTDGDMAHVDFIESLELEIEGLSHTAPADLDVYLIDPFGTTIEVMSDLGNMSPVSAVTLVFNDKGTAVPGIPITPGTYLPEGLYNGTDAGMATYIGGPNAGGTDAWLLLVIDDSPGDAGSFETYTLRGTVPEPATLSLLALGVLAAVCRRRS